METLPLFSQYHGVCCRKPGEITAKTIEEGGGHAAHPAHQADPDLKRWSQQHTVGKQQVLDGVGSGPFGPQSGKTPAQVKVKSQTKK